MRAEQAQRQLLVHGVVLGEQDAERVARGLLGVEIERAGVRGVAAVDVPAPRPLAS